MKRYFRRYIRNWSHRFRVRNYKLAIYTMDLKSQIDTLMIKNPVYNKKYIQAGKFWIEKNTFAGVTLVPWENEDLKYLLLEISRMNKMKNLKVAFEQTGDEPVDIWMRKFFRSTIGFSNLRIFNLTIMHCAISYSNMRILANYLKPDSAAEALSEI